MDKGGDWGLECFAAGTGSSYESQIPIQSGGNHHAEPIAAAAVWSATPRSLLASAAATAAGTTLGPTPYDQSLNSSLSSEAQAEPILSLSSLEYWDIKALEAEVDQLRQELAIAQGRLAACCGSCQKRCALVVNTPLHPHATDPDPRRPVQQPPASMGLSSSATPERPDLCEEDLLPESPLHVTPTRHGHPAQPPACPAHTGARPEAMEVASDSDGTQFQTVAFCDEKIGLNVTELGNWVIVKSIVPDSPAMRQGVSVGSIILTVGGKPCTNLAVAIELVRTAPRPVTIVFGQALGSEGFVLPPTTPLHAMEASQDPAFFIGNAATMPPAPFRSDHQVVLRTVTYESRKDVALQFPMQNLGFDMWLRERQVSYLSERIGTALSRCARASTEHMAFAVHGRSQGYSPQEAQPGGSSLARR